MSFEMNASNRPGRPRKHAGAVDKSAILACAMTMIEENGLDALSFRTLATRLGLTPMAISYHVGNRDQMIADLLVQSFEGIAEDVPDGTPSQKLRFLLLRYCDAALAKPSLVHCMLHDPTMMPEVILELNELIRQQTQTLNGADDGDVMLNLLIDYVHGFVFSAVAAPPHIRLTTEDCAKSIDWLLDMMRMNSSSQMV